MKKLILISIGSMFSLLASAQHGTDMNGHSGTSKVNTSIESSKTDGVMMKNGKMITVKGRTETAMSSDYTCSDGTKVSGNGTVTKKDGSTKMLKEGQYLDKSGAIMPVTTSAKTDKNKKMYLVPDSTAKKMNK